MIVFVALLLAVLTFAVVTYPLLRRRMSLTNVGEDDELRELHSARDTTYSMLKELEFDLQSDILSQEDYQELETRYKKKAISILKGIDEVGKNPDAEDEIEKQVQRRRRVKSRHVDSGHLDEELEKEILGLRRSQNKFCTQCGTRYQESDNFCSRCGAKLRKGEDID